MYIERRETHRRRIHEHKTYTDIALLQSRRYPFDDDNWDSAARGLLGIAVRGPPLLNPKRNEWPPEDTAAAAHSITTCTTCMRACVCVCGRSEEDHQRKWCAVIPVAISASSVLQGVQKVGLHFKACIEWRGFTFRY